MGKRLFLILILVAIAALTVITISLSKTKNSSTEVPQTTIPPAEASQLTSVDSPNGLQKLSMKTVKNNGETVYSFSTAKNVIFGKTVDRSVSFSIPLNAWSPDNKYVFLKETGPQGSCYFVLSASGNSSSQNEQTVNITDLFAKKYPDLGIGDVTGWGGVNLVIVNSDKSDGSLGPSFWFDVPSRSFIQLSTRF